MLLRQTAIKDSATEMDIKDTGTRTAAVTLLTVATEAESHLLHHWKNADQPGEEEMIVLIRDYRLVHLHQLTSPLSTMMVAAPIVLMDIARTRGI